MNIHEGKGNAVYFLTTCQLILESSISNVHLGFG